jgi:predicted ArsR family transcriptional regulator
VPLRLVVGGQYGDAALTVYIKIAALAMRPENCRAAVATIAEYLGLSKSAVERALTQLTTPGTDGVAEVVTIRHTARDGEGETAERYVRTMDKDELFVWLPARAATSLTPRQLRLYAAISYAQARRIPLALSDLQDVVRHQYGESAGERLGERQVMRLVDSLEDLGWVTVHRRQGPRGRHAYEAHQRPLHTVPETTEPVQEALFEPAASPDTHDGSAPRIADGSPSKEDHTTDRLLTKKRVGGGIRRRRTAGSYRAAPVDNSAGPTFRAAGHDEKRSNTSGAGTYSGPGLQLSPRVWRVLEPVRHHLPEISTYVMRRIGQEIGRQLCAGTGEHRLTDRLRLRYATTEAPRGGDVGRWILGAALVRHGCYLDSCESGFTWSTGAPCPVCIANQLAAADAGTPADPDGAQQQRPVPEERPLRQVVTDWVPRPAPAAEPPPTSDLTGEQLRELRAAATPDAVRQAVAEHGRTRALYLYGHRLVLPHLTESDPEGNPA